MMAGRTRAAAAAGVAMLLCSCSVEAFYGGSSMLPRAQLLQRHAVSARRSPKTAVCMAAASNNADKSVDAIKSEVGSILQGSPVSIPDAKSTMSEQAPRGSATKMLQDNEPEPFKDPSRTPPPKSFRMCVEQAYLSAKQAIEDGHKLIEIEFPPLPQSAMDNEAIGADTILKAQIQHSTDFAKLFKNKKTAIVFADIVERNRFIDDETSSNPQSWRGNIRFTALKGGFKGSLIERVWINKDFVSEVQEDDDMFIIIGASAQELPDVRELCKAAGDRPVILFNLKLQVLRGDFGLPFFPSKSLHNDWLCEALPAYFMLPKSYTKTIAGPPFLINYSGALFRTYPGKWQMLLEVPDEDGGGRYQRVRMLDKRPALSDVREELAKELQLDGLDGEEGQEIFGLNLKQLRNGVVVKTWWEKDLDDAKSDKWRS